MWVWKFFSPIIILQGKSKQWAHPGTNCGTCWLQTGLAEGHSQTLGSRAISAFCSRRAWMRKCRNGPHSCSCGPHRWVLSVSSFHMHMHACTHMHAHARTQKYLKGSTMMAKPATCPHPNCILEFLTKALSNISEHLAHSYMPKLVCQSGILPVLFTEWVSVTCYSTMSNCTWMTTVRDTVCFLFFIQTAISTHRWKYCCYQIFHCRVQCSYIRNACRPLCVEA